jgi:hypothetical protein
MRTWLSPSSKIDFTCQTSSRQVFGAATSTVSNWT